MLNCSHPADGEAGLERMKQPGKGIRTWGQGKLGLEIFPMAWDNLNMESEKIEITRIEND